MVDQAVYGCTCPPPVDDGGEWKHEWRENCPIHGSYVQPETFVRPNGKPYRPRAGIRVEMWQNDGYHDFDHGVIVLRTFNVDRARREAYVNGDGMYPSEPRKGWYRLTFDQAHGDGLAWTYDEVRGVPAVSFTLYDDPPEGWPAELTPEWRAAQLGGQS
jgi:hypothetical protein